MIPRASRRALSLDRPLAIIGHETGPDQEQCAAAALLGFAFALQTSHRTGNPESAKIGRQQQR
jgi:hypothetical protein